MLGWWKSRRRHRAAAGPFPEAWLSILSANVAHYPLLEPQQQDKLQHDLGIVVADKYWEGCGGLTITDEVKVTIAAQACLLLLGDDEPSYFERVLSILVYPSSFRDTDDELEWETPDPVGLDGRSVYRGPVILAWDAALEEGRDCSLGSNVVIHEFAHQLDDLDGSVNGTPALGSAEECQTWERVMTSEFRRLHRELRKGREPFLGEYAAKNETEFFAVASERFFTLPHLLRRYHPSLYELLAAYYRVEPTAWFKES